MKKIDKTIFVLGLGVSGMSLAKNLDFFFDSIFCWDDKKDVRDLANKHKLNLVEPNAETLKKTDFLVISPSINHHVNNGHPTVEIAKKLKIPIIADIELMQIIGLDNFSIGITGTNGKSTTTKFISDSLSFKRFREAKACGNIGIPFSELNIKKKTLLVTECSSFQLSKIYDLRFDISILLNISSDHLDWHSSYNEYIKSKMRIFKNQTSKDYAIICVDDQICENISANFKKNFKSNLIIVSSEKKVKHGIFLSENKNFIIIQNTIINKKIKINKRKISIPIIKSNLKNILITYAVNFILKRNINDFIESLNKLEPLEHRMELICHYENIWIYNDSKSTNVESSKMAISSMENIFWILGGRAKPGGLSGVEEDLTNITNAFTYGQDGRKFFDFLNSIGINVHHYKTLKEATISALNLALSSQKKINILLSPCAASYDQFKNFEERGKFFKKIVNKRMGIEFK